MVDAQTLTASGVEMMAYCWVKNEDCLATRTDVWLKLVHIFNVTASTGGIHSV